MPKIRNPKLPILSKLTGSDTRLIAIDPSVNHVGWATYSSKSKEWDWGLIEPRRGSLPFRMESIFAKLQLKIKFPITEVTDLVVEYPTFFEGTKGAIAAKMGYTNDLACIAGYIAGRCNISSLHINYFLPSEWKGNMPKTAIEHRFRREFGHIAAQSTTDHEQEAVMLGKFYLKEKGNLR